MLDVKKDKKIPLVLIALFLICALFFLVPGVQNFIFHFGQWVLRREFRRPEKWLAFIKCIFPLFCFGTAFFVGCYFYGGRLYSKIVKDKSFDVVFVLVPMFLYFFSALKGLSSPSLWVDETIEFWYSKFFVGKLPFEDTTNMYQRIISTYQPPLYNFLMCFWLKVSDSECWFRLFGVVAGAFGLIAIYKAVNFVANKKLGILALFLAATNVQYVYYSKEAAEYCLLLCFLSWAIYFFLKAVSDREVRNVGLFFVFSILAVYSQYGAIFPVFVMGMVLLFNVMLGKDNGLKKSFFTMALIAVVVFALPLYLFFIKPQGSRISSNANLKALVDKRIICDFFEKFADTIKYCMLDIEFGHVLSIVFALLIIASVFLIGFLSHNKKIDLSYVFFFVITWCVYYVLVKSSLYAYGVFGFRWGLFFTPLLIVFGLLFCYRAFEIAKLKFNYLRIYGFLRFVFIYAMCIILILQVFAVLKPIQKIDQRGVYYKWKSLDNVLDAKTLVFYNTTSGFAYYYYTDKNRPVEVENKIIYMPDMRTITKDYQVPDLRDKDSDFFLEYISQMFSERTPVVYFCISDYTEYEFNGFATAFENCGYVQMSRYEFNGGAIIEYSLQD